MYAKNHGPDSRDEKVICLSSNFRDRQADIVAYRGAVFNQKGSPRVHWTLGRLHAKNQGHQEILLWEIMTDQPSNRPTDRPTEGHEV